jgi:phage-related protein
MPQSNVLKTVTSNFLNQVIENEFWDWVDKKFFKEYNTVQEDLVELNDSTASKMAVMLDDVSGIIAESDISEQSGIKGKMKELKEKFPFNEVYKLKTFAKFIMKKINMSETEEK